MAAPRSYVCFLACTANSASCTASSDRRRPAAVAIIARQPGLQFNEKCLVGHLVASLRSGHEHPPTIEPMLVQIVVCALTILNEAYSPRDLMRAPCNHGWRSREMVIRECGRCIVSETIQSQRQQTLTSYFSACAIPATRDGRRWRAQTGKLRWLLAAARCPWWCCKELAG
jgi:hypothetical protein